MNKIKTALIKDTLPSTNKPVYVATRFSLGDGVCMFL
jgi:hypothetical protein